MANLLSHSKLNYKTKLRPDNMMFRKLGGKEKSCIYDS